MLLFSSFRSSILLLLSLITLTLTADPKYSETITISYELLSSPSKPSALATINYDPKSFRYTLTSWTPPSLDSLQSTSKSPTSAPLLRILTPSGSSTVTTLNTFSPDLKQHINLLLSADSSHLISASVTSLSAVPLTAEEIAYRKKVERAKARGKPIPPRPKPEKPKKPKKGTTPIPVPQAPVVDDTPEGEPKVNFVRELPPPSPKLLSRAPPQVDEHGNEVVAQEVQEKTFFQKYWWVFVGVMVLTMGLGGEK